MNAAPTNLATSIQSRLVGFVRMARFNDFRVGVAEEIDTQRVAALCGVDDVQRLRWGLRALLCNNQDDWARFDELFDAYWRPGNVRQRIQEQPRAAILRKPSQDAGSASGNANQPAASEADEPGYDEGDNAAPTGVRSGASAFERTAGADFRQLVDDGQMRELERLAEQLARNMRRRLIRRQKVQHHGRRIDLRHTFRASLRYGGTPLELVFRHRYRRPPRLLLIVDVSRSMSLYSNVFLRFARGIVNAFQEASAFAYHTTLVPITEALRQSDPIRMRTSLALISQGWSGGTRIGECLEKFNQDYRRLLTSRTLVLIVSDGLDTGEPTLLARQLADIRQQCRKLIWLSPLLGREGYEIKTASMLAALPHIDVLAPAHNLQSLLALENTLTSL